MVRPYDRDGRSARCEIAYGFWEYTTPPATLAKL